MKTKEIVPVSIWNDGQNRKASLLSVMSERDNFEDSCVLYYELIEDVKDNEGNFVYTGNLASGQIDFSGEDYQKWEGDNDYPFTFVAEKINIVLKS
jgi:hypothetical protein